MKNILKTNIIGAGLLIFVMLFVTKVVEAQCTLGSAIAPYDVSTLPIGTRTKIVDTISAGEYIPLENIEVDMTYTVDVCADPANTMLTLYDTSKTQVTFNSAGCGNDGKITFLADMPGTYYVQLSLNGCATDAIDHDFFVTVDSSFCSLGTPFSSYNTTPLADDTPTNISTTLKAGSYVTLQNIVANTTYTLSSCGDAANTSLTLFDPSNNPINFSSNGCGDDGEITFTSTISGNYKIQLNLDLCQSDVANHTVTIEKSSCSNPLITSLTLTQDVTCVGDTAIITINGNLNDADYWVIYKDELGVESIDTITNLIYEFKPLPGTRTYFFQGRGGCVYDIESDWDSITLAAILTDATFFYSSNSYCTAESDTIPTISGVSGGSFSSLPAGLSINSTTGRIDNSASTINDYEVVYTTVGTCPKSDTVELSITNLDDVTFSYGATSFCVSNSTITPTLSGTTSGTFSYSPAGLAFVASTGSINLGSSTPGTYKIKYSTTGPCANIDSVTIQVNGADNSSFSYTSLGYCVNSSDPTPTITGLTGGVFSSQVGLSLNTTTGVIDVSASNPGFYNVGYTTVGSCPSTTIFGVDIKALDNANYDYGKTSFCDYEADPLPSVSSPGVFSSTPPGLSIAGGNGLIDISASTVGSYTLTYTTSGSCPNTSSKTITLNGADNSAFTYPISSYCLTGTDPSPTVTGLTGGTFSVNPSGLEINSSTGVVDLSESVPYNYSVMYTTAGTCPSTTTVPFTVNNGDNASFVYDKNNYCVTSSDPTPSIVGLAGGSFSSTAGLTLNATTGTITIGTSTIGSYDVTYTTNGSCPNSEVQTIILSNLDDASFSYGAPSYCAFSTDALPLITGLTSGSFTSSPIGLSILQNNGYINTGASEPGTYTVTYTTAGDCQSSSAQSVTIIAADDATFNYGGVEYCPSDTDPIPTVAGYPTGNYTSSPSGMIINASTGEIDLSASLPEVYSVIYTTTGTCPNSSTQSIIIDSMSNAGFSYGSSNYCISGTDPAPIVTGESGGTFSASPSGMLIGTYTGLIDLSNSLPGTYTITYSVQGDCPNSANQLITIDDYDNAGFNYASTNYCTAGTDPTPIITGLSGGTFSSSPAGLLLYSSTGEVDLDASITGDYTVTYTTSGSCSNSSSKVFKLREFDDAGFSYSDTLYCVTENDPTPVVTGLVGGTFSSTPVGLSINSFSGKIDISASAPGDYDISYTTAGDCPNTFTKTITISSTDDATFNYSSANYCESAMDPVANITGLQGGSFSAIPTGLNLDITTGLIDLDQSTADTYSITYSTNGNCPATSIQQVTVNEIDNADFTYGQPSFCTSSANPYPSISGLFGGTFSASPSGMTIDANTGEIDINSSTLNSYVITYTTNGACPNTNTESIILNNQDDASFSYPSSVYCITNSNPIPQITGVSGGTFSYSPSGLSFNTSTGEINLANCLLGTYTITYGTSGTCQNSSSQVITITDVDDASFSYGTPNFCVNDIDPVPSITGITGGSFTVNPVGLVIDGQSGTVDIGASTAGSYVVLYTTATNCPTTESVIFNLRSIPVYNQALPGCDSIEINGNKYYNSQVIIDTLAGVYCDSIVNTDLTMNYANTGIDVVSAWCSLDWIDGITYEENNNTATHTLINQSGCDSVVTLNLTLTKIDTSLTIVNSTFASNESNATYQWVNCTQGFAPIQNATGKVFTPIQNGNYAVIVTKNGCTDTSACFFLTNVGIESNTFEIQVFPNPFDEMITIEFSNTMDAEIFITNVEGKTVLEERVFGNIHVISTAALDSGIYFLRIVSSESEQNIKLIKQ